MKLLRATSILAAVAHAAAFTSRSTFGVRSMSALGIAVGDKIPDVGLMQGFPDVKTISVADYAKGKNVIIVGLPGAFTPT